jgi:1-acyl-sn-glycerol-3-phosphate acyltransferase
MKYIISIWEWVVGVGLFIIFISWFAIVASIWPYEKYIVWTRSFLQFFFKALFIKVEVEGAENIDPEQTYLFMPNHVSMFDIPLVLGYIPVEFYGIQAASHFKMPLYGWVLKKYGNIPIDRSSPRASFRTMMNVVEVLKKGTNILVLPEGTRTTTPQMAPFKKLPFLMAKKSEVNIMPMAFVGLWEINNKTSLLVRPGKMKVVFGKPIPSSTVKELSEVELRNLTRQKIQELLDAK